jgi:hypothetical protein
MNQLLSNWINLHWLNLLLFKKALNILDDSTYYTSLISQCSVDTDWARTSHGVFTKDGQVLHIQLVHLV